MQKTKGFTIIELIVVVAIIAVLAAIVGVNVVTYLNKGKDSAIKANLGTLQAAGIGYIDTNPAGATACTSDTTVANAYAQIGTLAGAANADCNNAAGVFAACATLKATSGDYFCVDSTGNKKQITGTCLVGATATVCPASGNF